MTEHVGVEVDSAAEPVLVDAADEAIVVEGFAIVGPGPFGDHNHEHGTLTGLSDPDHPIAAVQGLQPALDGKAATGHAHAGVYEPAGSVATHTAAADPHAGYQKESEKAQPSGYASLDGTGKVPASQLPAAGVTDHGALSGLGDDDHPQYLRGAEVLGGFDIAVTQGAGTVTVESETQSTDTLYYAWSNAVSGAPADGTIRANNLSPASVTQLAISERTADSTDTAGLIALLAAGHVLAVKNRLSAATSSQFNVAGAPTDQGAYWTVPVTFAGGNGSFPSNGVSTAVLWKHPGGTFGSAGGVGSGISPAIVDAKGDLIVGTAADTVARLPVGATAGHVLKVNSATATGLEWGAPSGGGAAWDVPASAGWTADVWGAYTVSPSAANLFAGGSSSGVTGNGGVFTCNAAAAFTRTFDPVNGMVLSVGWRVLPGAGLTSSIGIGAPIGSGVTTPRILVNNAGLAVLDSGGVTLYTFAGTVVAATGLKTIFNVVLGRGFLLCNQFSTAGVIQDSVLFSADQTFAVDTGGAWALGITGWATLQVAIVEVYGA